MLDHRKRARQLRVRANKCRGFAENTTSIKFSECYRLIAENYNILATVEEEFYERNLLLQTES